MQKYALFAFNGDVMCFVHVLLNAVDMGEKGFDVKVIIEGSATKTVTMLNEARAPFYKLYRKVVDMGLIDCVCKACAAKMGALEGVEAQGLPLCGEMTGHPSMAKYIKQGYQVITF